MSGRKNVLPSYAVISAGDMSSASLTSKPTNILYLDDVGVQATWSGSPVGLVSVEVSADYAATPSGEVTNAGNWAPLTFTYYNGATFVTATSIPTSVGSPIYLDLALLSAPWLRVVYTKTSGTGSLTVMIVGKDV